VRFNFLRKNFHWLYLHTTGPKPLPPLYGMRSYIFIPPKQTSYFLPGTCNSLFLEQFNFIFTPLDFGTSHTRHTHFIWSSLRLWHPPWRHNCAVQTPNKKIKQNNEDEGDEGLRGRTHREGDKI